MAVHAVIFISFVASVYFNRGDDLILPSMKEMSMFILLGLIWILIRTYIITVKDIQHYQSENVKLKHNPKIFLSLVNNQPKINIPQSLKVFTFGKVSSEHELTFISNPFCVLCAKAHKVIEDWLRQGLDFKISIIFIHSPDINDRRRIFAKYIASITDQTLLENSLKDWFNTFGSNDIADWAKQFNLQSHVLPYNEDLLEGWLKMAGVSTTPSFFINGQRLPKIYQITDIRYLINEVINTPSCLKSYE